ncbi:MAG: NADP-dependent oxidoreductase, partial [Actinomycetota bacterium]|nr:NADP-dependent oxidoreductase [Actinomycetota bacterium]
MPDSSSWEIVSAPIPTVADGEFLVQLQEFSMDPAMRGWMNASPAAAAAVELGQAMRATGAGTVIDSRHPTIHVGSQVVGMFNAQAYAVSDGTGVTVVDPELGSSSMYLGLLGLSGLTAYFGLIAHANPRAGDTVVVSAAAGAVGSIVGQLATLSGCRTIGIAGGSDKCARIVAELGYDIGLDYKHPDFLTELSASCPEGIDLYFDNVGGEVLNAALGNIALHGHAVLCGGISQYNATSRPPGPSNNM